MSEGRARARVFKLVSVTGCERHMSARAVWHLRFPSETLTLRSNWSKTFQPAQDGLQWRPVAANRLWSHCSVSQRGIQKCFCCSRCSLLNFTSDTTLAMRYANISGLISLLVVCVRNLKVSQISYLHIDIWLYLWPRNVLKSTAVEVIFNRKLFGPGACTVKLEQRLRSCCARSHWGRKCAYFSLCRGWMKLPQSNQTHDPKSINKLRIHPPLISLRSLSRIRTFLPPPGFIGLLFWSMRCLDPKCKCCHS